MRNHFVYILLIATSLCFYAEENIRVISTDAIVLDKSVVFNIEVQNIGKANVYLLLDYELSTLEYNSSIKTIFASVTSKPISLNTDGYTVSDIRMPRINVVYSGQRQFISVIIQKPVIELASIKDKNILRTVISGLVFFVLEPPNYENSGTSISSYEYNLYTGFYKDNAQLFDTRSVLYGM